ncbi:MAG: NADPH-dependent F420 reductase [Rhodospirillaceae bacterium]
MTIQISRRTAIALGFGFSFSAYAGSAPLRIGTVGAGRMGSALGSVFVKAGHEVMFSSRNPDELKDMVAALGPKAKAGTVEEAIAFAEVPILLVPYSAMPEIAKSHGAALAAKPLVIDVSNPILPRDGEIGEQARQQGPGTFLAGLMPGVKLVRAFNAINFAAVGELSARSEKVGVPIAGDDPKALELASSLIRGIGFEPVTVGNLAFGRHLLPGEPLAGVHAPAALKQIATTLK